MTDKLKVKQMLLAAPDNELDSQFKPMIEKWEDEPSAIQILELLDQVVHSGGGSGFVVTLLNTLLSLTIMKEKTTYNDVVKQAVWRTE